MKYNINPADYYPHLLHNPYPEFVGEAEITDATFRQGDVVFDEGNNAIAIVLGTIDLKGGELRLDTEGMQPIENLRPATLEDFEKCKYRTRDMHQKLFLECCEQQGVVPMRFQIKATIKKNVMVYATPKNGEATEDIAREIAHQQFNPNEDGTEEEYTEDSQLLPKLFD